MRRCSILLNLVKFRLLRTEEKRNPPVYKDDIPSNRDLNEGMCFYTFVMKKAAQHLNFRVQTKYLDTGTLLKESAFMCLFLQIYLIAKNKEPANIPE
jgi:hypothetical protein